jgi:hypothetical protein
MADTKITLRPDATLLADLDTLTAAGAPNRAAAIRDAVHVAARSARIAQAAADARRLAADPADRAEIAIIRELMGTDDAW